jgi:hypothetical protein
MELAIVGENRSVHEHGPMDRISNAFINRAAVPWLSLRLRPKATLHVFLSTLFRPKMVNAALPMYSLA